MTPLAWKRSVAVALLALCVVAAAPAWGFTLLTTQGGQPKVWRKPALEYRVVYDEAAPEPAASEGASLGERIDVAMAPWSEVRCAKDGGEVSVDVGFKMTAPAEVASCSDDDKMMNCAGGDGVVRVVAKEERWPISDLTVGYTILASDGQTGVNTRFVLLLNDASYDFCDTSCDGHAFDIRTVALHEAGHVLGLDHSALSSAVMADGRTPAEILRTLQSDDIAGICTIYPANAADPGGLCSAGRAGAPQPLLALLALAGLTLLLWRRRGQAGALWIFAAVVALPAPAEAFTLARSPSGAHQRWSVADISWDLDETGLQQQGVANAEVEAAAAAAFATWEAVRCGLCHDSRGVACEPVACAEHALGVRFAFDGWRPPRAPGLGCAVREGGAPCTGKPDGNQILFVYDQAAWPVATHVIALTLVAADKVTGQIADADVLVNTAHKSFCVAPDCALGRYDVQNTLTHEVGHLLGLDHSAEADATMYGGAPPDEVSKRDLTADDVTGVCTAYRMAYAAQGCPPAVDEAVCTAAPGRGAGAAGRRSLGSVAVVAASALVVALRRQLA